MSTPIHEHGDTTNVCGTDCTFVAYSNAIHLRWLAKDLGLPAPSIGVANVSCSFCPACQDNDACSRQHCAGGYWVTADKLPVLKLRGMP